MKFDIKALAPDILSENMTANAWGDLLKIFRDEVIFDDYKGIIVLHGTDTLAYTSAFFDFFSFSGKELAQQGREDRRGFPDIHFHIVSLLCKLH